MEFHIGHMRLACLKPIYASRVVGASAPQPPSPPYCAQYFSSTKRVIVHMPHSITPGSTPAYESSATVSQTIMKSEPTEDVAMDDAPSPAKAEDTVKVDLEDLFDDDDEDDEEFASSAPVKSEQEASQPAATLYASARQKHSLSNSE